MSTENPIAPIVPLNDSRWQAAKSQALATVRAKYQEPQLAEPQLADFQVRAFEQYPAWLTRSLAAGLAIVAAVAFIISAGKMIVAADTTLSPLLQDSSRLSQAWLNAVILLSLVFGEVGTALFSLASAIFPGHAITVGRFRFRPVALIFRCSALVSAGLAIAGNVGVSITHYQQFMQVALFGWGLTMLPPAAVIIVSLLAEKMVLANLEARAAAYAKYELARAQALADFEQARHEWLANTANLESDSDFRPAFYLAIMDQLERISPKNRQAIAELVDDNPQIRVLLVERDLQRHTWTRWVVADSARPTMPGITGPITPDSPLHLLPR